MIIQRIVQILEQSAGNPIGIMKRSLNSKVRPGNKLPHRTTGLTADSITASQPKLIGSILEWVFKSNEAAVRLNTGGSLKEGAKIGEQQVPYGKNLGKKKKRGQSKAKPSKYIEALTDWAMKKYGIPYKKAKRVAFKIAQRAVENGQTVKSAGWLEDAKREIAAQINQDIKSIALMEVNIEINRALGRRI